MCRNDLRPAQTFSRRGRRISTTISTTMSWRFALRLFYVYVMFTQSIHYRLVRGRRISPISADSSRARGGRGADDRDRDSLCRDCDERLFFEENPGDHPPEPLVIPRPLGKRAEGREIGTDLLAQAADSVHLRRRSVEMPRRKVESAAFPARERIAHVHEAAAARTGRTLEPAAMAAEGDFLPTDDDRRAIDQQMRRVTLNNHRELMARASFRERRGRYAGRR